MGGQQEVNRQVRGVQCIPERKCVQTTFCPRRRSSPPWSWGLDHDRVHPMADKDRYSPDAYEHRLASTRRWHKEHAEHRRQWRKAYNLKHHLPMNSPELRAKKAASLAHRNRARRRPYEDRFWEKVEKTGTCWLWRGAIERQGYGVFENRKAHRIAFTLIGGVIPTGLQLDHLCFVRHCVNPDHLEPVTAKENVRRARART